MHGTYDCLRTLVPVAGDGTAGGTGAADPTA